MNLKQYPYFTSENFRHYSFYSEGPKGIIKKVVTYTQMDDDPVVFNLAFGDLDPKTGQIMDRIKSNNNDRDMVLNTVANTVTAFSNHFGNRYIYATGSTPERTRLYQISIARLLDQITLDYEVLGFKDDNWHPFEKNVNYEAFLVKRKD